MRSELRAVEKDTWVGWISIPGSLLIFSAVLSSFICGSSLFTFVAAQITVKECVISMVSVMFFVSFAFQQVRAFL